MHPPLCLLRVRTMQIIGPTVWEASGVENGHVDGYAPRTR